MTATQFCDGYFNFIEKHNRINQEGTHNPSIAIRNCDRFIGWKPGITAWLLSLIYRQKRDLPTKTIADIREKRIHPKEHVLHCRQLHPSHCISALQSRLTAHSQFFEHFI